MGFRRPRRNFAVLHFDLVRFATGMQQREIADDWGRWGHEVLSLHKDNPRKLLDQIWVGEVPRLVHQHLHGQWKRARGDVWSRCSEEVLQLYYPLSCAAECTFGHATKRSTFFFYSYQKYRWLEFTVCLVPIDHYLCNITISVRYNLAIVGAKLDLKKKSFLKPSSISPLEGAVACRLGVRQCEALQM